MERMKGWATLKRTKSRIIMAGIVILAAVILYDRICVADTIRQYPQLRLQREELYGDHGENLKDFVQMEDGSLRSESSDPWIDYALPETMNIKSVEIMTESVSLEGTWAQLHFVLADGTWIHESFYIHSGKNQIMANDKKGLTNVSKVRFDLVSKSEASVKTDQIVINAADTLTRKYHWISLGMILLVIFAMRLPGRIQKYKKAEVREVLPGIVISIAIAFLLCIFAPLDLYFNNQEEFWFDLYTMLPLTAGMFVIAALVLSILMVILFFIHKKLYQMGAAFGFVLLICTYVQGNFLVGNLPPLDGTEFHWEDYASLRWQSVLLWAIGIVLVIFCIRMLPAKKFYGIAACLSGGLTVMLLLTLCIECVTVYGYQHKLSARVTSKNQFEMSKERNFIILMLDALDGGTFWDVVNNNPAYKEVFRDFTYYPDTMGAYSFTSRAVPFILSGEWFENEQHFAKYNENAYKNTGIFSKLEKENYKLGVYETEIPLTDESIYRFDNVQEYQNKIKSYIDFAGLEWKLVGFKYAPFDLKKDCVVYASEFRLMKDETGKNQEPSFSSSNRSFYEHLQNEEVTYTDQKCFRFFHMEGAHVPFRYDKDVNVIENGTYEQNIEASIKITDTYLKKLKHAKVYDQSVIIVMSDHGYEWKEGYPYGRQNPLLMIKGIGENHEMQISNAPISYDDLQSAYEKLLKGTAGSSVFEWKEKDQRERRYLWFRYLEEDHMIEYLQTGKASDPDAMRPTGREFRR